MDIDTLKNALGSAVDVMQATGFSVGPLLSRVGEVSNILLTYEFSFSASLKGTLFLEDIVSHCHFLLADYCSAASYDGFQVEKMNALISELAIISAHERAMLGECEALLASTAAVQVRVSFLMNS